MRLFVLPLTLALAACAAPSSTSRTAPIEATLPNGGRVEILSLPDLIYPPLGLQQGITAKVVLQLTIDSVGKVVKVEVSEANSSKPANVLGEVVYLNREFISAAVTSARASTWRVTGAAPVLVSLPFDFKLPWTQ